MKAQPTCGWSRQGQYGVNYKHYWVDEKEGKVFCLVDAPERNYRHGRTELLFLNQRAVVVQPSHDRWLVEKAVFHGPAQSPSADFQLSAGFQ